MESKKTRDSQIKASINYDKRNSLVTIACKVNLDYKKRIIEHYQKKGYTSINSYLLDLIKKDME